jgi:hypothetical protein
MRVSITPNAAIARRRRARSPVARLCGATQINCGATQMNRGATQMNRGATQMNCGAARIGSWSPLGEKLDAASANRSLRAGYR